jgi:hypothetical protein
MGLPENLSTPECSVRSLARIKPISSHIDAAIDSAIQSVEIGVKTEQEALYDLTVRFLGEINTLNMFYLPRQTREWQGERETDQK